MALRVDIGASDIMLLMLDDELQWEPLMPSELLALTCDDFSILSIRLFTDRRVSCRCMPTRWRRCAISCCTTEFSREFCVSWLAMAAAEKLGKLKPILKWNATILEQSLHRADDSYVVVKRLPKNCGCANYLSSASDFPAQVLGCDRVVFYCR